MRTSLTFAISSNMCILLGKRCKSSAKSSKPPAKRFRGNITPNEKKLIKQKTNISESITTVWQHLEISYVLDSEHYNLQRKLSYLCNHLKQCNIVPQHIAAQNQQLI